MKSLNVEEETWKALVLLKLELKASSMDELINILLVRSKTMEMKAK